MANYTDEQWNARKIELMEKCFDCFAEHGLHGTGIRVLANECGFNHTKLYTYFRGICAPMMTWYLKTICCD